ncbi:hypothetical protein V6N11_045050 [Hibiscus sabdariffa]|uniref:Uncharacterized protein n=2 Tax=Hibiscus sabdariffa TaxID=183260 RepID=A0ABR2CV05_9ROSI
MVRLADFVRLKEHRSSSSDGRAEDFTAIYGDFQWPSRETSLIPFRSLVRNGMEEVRALDRWTLLIGMVNDGWWPNDGVGNSRWLGFQLRRRDEFFRRGV